MAKRRYAVFNEIDGHCPVRGVGLRDAVRIAIEHGLGGCRIQAEENGAWMLYAGAAHMPFVSTGFGVTAADQAEAERGCLAIASVRRAWGRCTVVHDEDVEALLACVVA